MMVYQLQPGNTVSFVFSGPPYPPPTDGSQLQFNLVAGDTVAAPFPEPPSLVAGFGARWGEGSGLQESAPVGWNDAAGKNIETAAPFHEAGEVPARNRALSWDTLPTREKVKDSGWQDTGQEIETGTDSHWSTTKATDRIPAETFWNRANPADGLDTAALWGQPALQDLPYGSRWFRVDTTAPVWRLNDHRDPPLWNDPPGALAFRFQGVVYRPQTMPPVWFVFGGSVAPHPIQPKDSHQNIAWQQATQHNHGASAPWGEGRYERIRDRIKRIPYSGEEDPDPPPDPAEEKDFYLLMNTVNVVRVSDDTPIELLDISIELDVDSFTWRLSATVANRATLALIEPDATGTKDIRVTINGWAWVFMVDRYDARRSFNQERYSIQGESRTRLLSEPYAPLRTKTEASAINGKQAAEAELSNTGFTLTWDTSSTGATPDWTFPAGVFSYVDQSPMQIIARIATTAGAIVVPATGSDNLVVQPRYKFSSWAWGDAATVIDHNVPESMVLNMSVEWTPEPAYNAVYVSGTYEGVAVEVTRSGTAGNEPAPDIVEDWLVDAGLNTERGRNVLAEGGQQAVISIDIPLTQAGQEPGLVLPGQLVEVMETPSWVGLCLATSIRTTGSGTGRVVQTLQIERHY